MTELFRYQGLAYKQGVHDAMYYCVHDEWIRSSVITEEILTIVDVKADPFSYNDEEKEHIDKDRLVNKSALIKRMVYLEWRNGGPLSVSDISKIISRAYKHLNLSYPEKEKASASQRKTILLKCIDQYPKRTQLMIQYFYSDPELSLIDVAVKFKLSTEHTRLIFRQSFNRSRC